VLVGVRLHNNVCSTDTRPVPGPVECKPQATPFPGSLAGSTRLARFFDCVFECVGFSYVVLDLVCSSILPSDWLAEPCPKMTKQFI